MRMLPRQFIRGIAVTARGRGGLRLATIATSVTPINMDYTKFFAKITHRRETNLIRQITEIYMSQPKSINLAGGMPNVATYPIKDISVTYDHSGPLKFDKSELSTALQYGAAQGYIPLLRKWREFQKTWHALKRNDWDVMFTNGSMDGCNKIFEMMIDENDPIMIQSPTYTGVLGALRPLAPSIIEIHQDADGVIPERIATECEQRLADGRPMPKFIYLNPTGANPTGTVLSEERRKKIYELAQRYDFLIVEDDAYFFIHFLDKLPTSFLSLDTDGRVIRLDSFSKIMSAGIRIGVVTAHKNILSKLIIHVENSSLQPSSLSQMVLYKLFETWNPHTFEEHFESVREFYQKRRDIMLTAVKKHLTGLAEWNVPQAGFFIWIKVANVDNMLDLMMKKCITNGVLAVPGNAFNYDSSRKSCYVRFSYSYSTPEKMDKGISILAKIIREETA